jgi:hypothetical protein
LTISLVVRLLFVGVTLIGVPLAFAAVGMEVVV